ncbi:hypothetical protein D7X12_39410 [Corallococcus sicarius]|uniref:Tetratricopeptide repeat protein n=2 Tax=Corallococcus sicarius TaxID=2316726 RepID=A0A3A8MSV4_9BACT|nr:hypothetical protein D7X12_39410 [Corallococcus sicarius]
MQSAVRMQAADRQAEAETVSGLNGILASIGANPSLTLSSPGGFPSATSGLPSIQHGLFAAMIVSVVDGNGDPHLTVDSRIQDSAQAYLMGQLSEGAWIEHLVGPQGRAQFELAMQIYQPLIAELGLSELPELMRWSIWEPVRISAASMVPRSRLGELLVHLQGGVGPDPALQEPLAREYLTQGVALCNQAMKEGADSDRLFAQGEQKFAEAVRLKPDMPEAFGAWGVSLCHRALGSLMGDTGKSDRLFAQGEQKFAEAVRLRPDRYQDLLAWSSVLSLRALLVLALLKKGEEAEHLFELARQKLEKAEGIKPGSAAYELACIAARTGHEQDCRAWLHRAREHGALPEVERLRSDARLGAVRKQQWFTALLQNHEDRGATHP